jgi:hypothetical protein
MKKEQIGTVVKHNLDSRNRPYTVIEMKNEMNLNYRVFVPGQDFKLGDKIRVSLERANGSNNTPKPKLKEKEVDGNQQRGS